MKLSELYDGYKLPLKIEVVKTMFSHPENFVKRSSRKGEPTHIEDAEGSWMNAGAGGESNTIDLNLQLKDQDGKHVVKCDIIPICVRLWCTENGLVVDGVIDQVSQTTEQDKSGHRRGESHGIMVSGKASSSLHINHDGSGFVCVRITTTSQLNERRKFTVEAAPDFTLQPSILSSLRTLFGKHECRPRDTILSNRSLSQPIEVMSKINKLSRMRGGHDFFRQAHSHLERAVAVLTDGINKHGPQNESVPSLLAICEHITTLLSGYEGPDAPTKKEKTEKVVNTSMLAYEKATSDVGILDLDRYEASLLEGMVSAFMTDPETLTKLSKKDNIRAE